MFIIKHEQLQTPNYKLFKMNLNRNNYEEFFLLYVDGELNPAQMQLVEEFVQANPDLQEELDMLKDAVLSIDNDIVFADKNLLFKSSAVGSINTSNYQENFLLYVDNELNNEAKESVETFVLKNPALQDEFTLLKSTKLEVEHIACPDKESLYKKEERPVVFMWVKRLSVAAAILLLAVMAWMLVPSNKTVVDNGGLASNDKGTTNQQKSAPTVTSTPNNTSTTGTKQDEEKVEQQPIVDTKTAVAVTSLKDNKKAVEKNIINIKSPAPQQRPNKAETQNNIAYTQQPSVPKQEQQYTTIPKEQQVVAVNNANPKNENNSKATVIPAVNTNNVTAFAQPAVYRELNTDDEQEAKTVYIGSMEIKKDKLNGLFKKAKKLFAKKQNDDAPTTKETYNSSPTRTLR